MSHHTIRNYVKITEVKHQEHIVLIVLLTHIGSSLTMNFHELLGLLRKIDILKSMIICDRSTILVGFCLYIYIYTEYPWPIVSKIPFVFKLLICILLAKHHLNEYLHVKLECFMT